jgi:hypothetical protein
VKSSDEGRHWSDPKSLSVDGEGDFDLELQAIVDRCGVTHIAYQSPSGVRYALFNGDWSPTRSLFTTMRTRDIALVSDQQGAIEMVWSNFHSSLPHDSLVHFQHFHSARSVQSNGRGK